MLFSIAFVILFTFGGFTGLMLSIAAADIQYHDTYFVVAHFHYVMVAGAVFSEQAGLLLVAKRCGKMYDETMGKVQFWIAFIGFNITFMPQHLWASRYAKTLCRLWITVCRLEYGFKHWRLYVRCCADTIPV